MSSALRWDESRTWTADDLDELPSDVDWRRFEIVDGALVVSPHAIPRHELIVARLIVALSGTVPAGFQVIGASMIDLRPSYRVTDVTVIANSVFAQNQKLVSPDDMLLAVEIESPSSITTDRITKPAQYAAAGIEHFWRIETDPLLVHAYRLDGDVYRPVGTWSAGERVQIREPFAAEFDVDLLLPSSAG